MSSRAPKLESRELLGSSYLALQKAIPHQLSFGRERSFFLVVPRQIAKDRFARSDRVHESTRRSLSARRGATKGRPESNYTPRAR